MQSDTSLTPADEKIDTLPKLFGAMYICVGQLMDKYFETKEIKKGSEEKVVKELVIKEAYISDQSVLDMIKVVYISIDTTLSIAREKPTDPSLLQMYDSYINTLKTSATLLTGMARGFWKMFGYNLQGDIALVIEQLTKYKLEYFRQNSKLPSTVPIPVPSSAPLLSAAAAAASSDVAADPSQDSAAKKLQAADERLREMEKALQEEKARRERAEKRARAEALRRRQEEQENETLRTELHTMCTRAEIGTNRTLQTPVAAGSSQVQSPAQAISSAKSSLARYIGKKHAMLIDLLSPLRLIPELTLIVEEKISELLLNLETPVGEDFFRDILEIELQEKNKAYTEFVTNYKQCIDLPGEQLQIIQQELKRQEGVIKVGKNAAVSTTPLSNLYGKLANLAKEELAIPKIKGLAAQLEDKKEKSKSNSLSTPAASAAAKSTQNGYAHH